MRCATFILITLLTAVSFAAESDVLFCIGTPDAFCAEFALVKEGYAAFPQKFPNNVRYEIGKSKPENDWAFLHPTKQDESWAKGGPVHPFTIIYNSDKDVAGETALVIGYMGVQGDLSDVNVSVNETKLPVQLPQNVGNGNLVFNPRSKGKPAAMVFKIPAGAVHKGQNEIIITLVGKSWILYDYVALRQTAKPLVIRERPEKNLLAEFEKNEMKGVKKIIFTTRTQSGEHWYANIGYYAATDQVGTNPPAPNEGGRLCLLDLDTKKVDILLDKGLVRDPCVHYSGKKVLFSYKPDGTDYFHLCEMDLTDKNLRQLTFGEFDDFEPMYTPEDKIIFVSTRAKRWVNCWLTHVAILYGCDADGKNIHQLSGNIEQDNTPWMLPNGQVLFTRWEYVDRSQVNYHHLWTMNPDGTRQMVFFGNMHPGGVWIDAKPVPNSEKIVASLSWGHGSTEHAGGVGLIDPRNGPDAQDSVKVVGGKQNGYRDPWAFSENCFIAATGNKIELFNADGDTQTLYQIPQDWMNEIKPKVIRER
ncbi:MAG: hypothetical protein LBN39_09660, partial [Planctomycetaceae bacterium]|nr:hypothetical protein [Planctomycetaceae bacterium]